MNTLAIDIETYSSNDLKKGGVYKYTEAADFTVLLLAYSINGGEVEVVDMSERYPSINCWIVTDDDGSTSEWLEFPNEADAMGLKIDEGRYLMEPLIKALTDPTYLKTAYNANFERTCLSKYLGIDLPAEQWECTMAGAAHLGLPLSLAFCAKALKLDQMKDEGGSALIKYFSVPCKPTKVNGGRTRNLPEHDPEKWMKFVEYCRQDVVVEQAIREKIAFFKPIEMERKLWNLDQKINDYGVLVDPVFVRNAIQLDRVSREALTEEAIRLTGLQNPNSVAQLRQWIGEETDTEVETLRKDDIPELLTRTEDETVKRVLGIRQEMSKTSIKKYAAMANTACADNRVRGLFQYYGANRTGRWAGRLVQVQNLTKHTIKDVDLARQLVRAGDLDCLQVCYGGVPDILSQLIRTAFVASPGHRFIVADFSAIEARVIAWLAGEKWRLEVFSGDGKIYEASGAHMFKVPIESITKSSPLRQKAKIAELALGYQGGPGALEKMGALKMGIAEEELPKLVAMWRNANKRIVEYWELIGDAALDTVREGVGRSVGPVKFLMEKGALFIELPSGRRLSYLRAQIAPNRFNSHSVTYDGMDQTTKQWKRQETYGGKLVENIVQAVARDLLADAMLRIDAAGYRIVMHVHDEVVVEMPDGVGSLEELVKIMSRGLPWSKGLPLGADGYETLYYKKD